MQNLLFLIASALIAVAPAAAEDRPCSDYVGKVIQPASIDTAILQLSKVPKFKGEFETQAQFQQRQKAALASVPATYVIAKSLDLKQVAYDADAGAFRVHLFAFDNLNIEYGEVFGSGTPFDGKVPYDMLHNIDIVVSQHEASVGRYVGGNALGAHARVTEVLRTIKVVFEGPGDRDLFLSIGPDHIIGNIAVPPAQAQRLKPTLSGAIVIRPKWPFVAQGTHHWPASFDFPEDTNQRTTAVSPTLPAAWCSTAARRCWRPLGGTERRRVGRHESACQAVVVVRP